MFPQGRSLIIADGGFFSLLACACARETALGQATAGGLGGSGGRSRTRREAPAGAPVAWIPRFGGGGDLPADDPEARRAALRAAIRSGHAQAAVALARTIAAERQAAALGLEIARSERVYAPDSNGAGESHALLEAAGTAARAGCAAVVWPVRCGGVSAGGAAGRGGGAGAGDGDVDVDEVARAVDRAVLVSRLAALDADELGAEAEVRAPFVDLSNHQAAELAVDMDLPVHLCWWWGPVLEAQGGMPDAASPPEAGRVPQCARQEFARWMASLEHVGFFPAGRVA